MSDESWSAADRRQIEAHGLSVEEVTRQLGLYRRPPNYARLLRSCCPDDGIVVLTPQQAERLRAIYEQAVSSIKAVKFVPASGAATRMFKAALQWLGSSEPLPRSRVRDAAAAGDRAAAELETLLAGLPALALWPPLSAAMQRDGLDPIAACEGSDVRIALEYLLTPRGLGAAELPKALLPFHRYGDEIRTPIEEHMVEAADYVRDGQGCCRVHFTVSAEHMDACRELARKAALTYGERFGVRYVLGFSVQEPCTDVVAVDPQGRPFRERDGRLLLRPAGHGALLRNLAALDGDVVFLKNIDNVLPDRLKPPVNGWKRALGGLLVELQREVFAHLDALDNGADDAALDAAISFLERRLGVSVDASSASAAERRRRAIEQLDRPLRVCGMVLNRGEAGGGPFWVENSDGMTKQIVESAQVDPREPEQQQLLRSSTHFSPVDIVCALRDRSGRPYDLARYVDEDGYLCVEKSHEGRVLRSIERPGLWNASMAYWNSVFVEVPLETFAPVKTINDLLRPEHR